MGPNTVQFKKPIILAIPHCINYNLEPINPAVIKNNLSNERITPDNFYGWEIEVKPPGPQLKVCHHQNSPIKAHIEANAAAQTHKYFSCNE